MNKFIYILLWLSIGSFSTFAQHVYNEVQEVTTLDKVFSKGNFTSFYKGQSGKFTLVVRNLNTGGSYEIEDPQLNTIVSDQLFIAGTISSRYLILNTETLKTDTLSDVRSLEFLEKRKQILYSCKKTGAYYIWNLKSGSKERLSAMVNYRISPDEQRIIYQDATKEVYSYNLDTKKRYKVGISSENLKDMVWDASSEKVYFVSRNVESYQVSSFDSERNTISEILKFDLKGCKVDLDIKNLHLYNNRWLAVAVLDDDIKLTETGPEVWLGISNGITSHIKSRKHFMPQMVLVDLKEKKVQNFFRKGTVNSFVIGRESPFVLIYDRLKKEDFTKHFPDVEMEVYGLEKNAVNSSIPVISGDLDRFVGAYNSNRIYYFKDKAWWMLDMRLNKTVNITKDLDGVFFKDYDEYCEIDCGPAGRLIITEDPDIVYLTDVFDIWEYNVKKGSAVRITSGREQGRRYSFAVSNFNFYSHPWQYQRASILRSGKKNLLKYVNLNDFSEGICILNSNNRVVEQIADGLGNVSEVRFDETAIVYKEESFNLPPRIVYLNPESKKRNVLYNSNRADTLAAQSKVELYRSVLNNNGTGGAVIRYPLNFDPQKKYPAVVLVYEKKTPYINRYQNLSDPTGAGFNYRSYINDGYFVIEPDIHYKIGNPGYSATESVNAVLDEVIKKYPIDENRLGLTGHSFGGYETNFIITQTNRFKAAVSSAGISDPSAWYLTMNWNTMRSEFWRFEDQSFRIKDGLFQNPDLYIANSPIFNSTQINTPLLIWTGKKDYHVNWSQSVSMFLALKRQNKTVNLLLYPDEAHVLSNFDNKVDAAVKVKQWFDFYLKGRAEPVWLN
ncbi:Dipeptidyl aminopeptidase/acylaminoacyl peptidase [Sphingobacterium nematocida]|uniref:Dipeptidyl aminopeptidase/acylaminoacyl peptidase n=1 Tax=Sphingobacterium nematocida TaxID=1513896 RepID=A0A1T5GQG7_9SPHI|nr:prolyl oligopeptidase family serine peptidase [Sphingobacterium nematocida]SKC10653.1 Dipeptidyl aminopeptidase/acylaminoacyl peptidase [Sphingobacterium nematocida]